VIARPSQRRRDAPLSHAFPRALVPVSGATETLNVNYRARAVPWAARPRGILARGRRACRKARSLAPSGDSGLARNDRFSIPRRAPAQPLRGIVDSRRRVAVHFLKPAGSDRPWRSCLLRGGTGLRNRWNVGGSGLLMRA
jgi:hypothetical protein